MATIFTGSSATAVEGGTLRFTLTRSAPAIGGESVAYSVRLDNWFRSPQAGDFTGPLTGTATFAAGATQAFIELRTVDDRLNEGTEYFDLALSNPSTGDTISGSGLILGTITDNDPATVFSVSGPASVDEGAGSIIYTVTRTGDAEGAQSLNLSLSGTADSLDRGFGPSSVSFAQGETTKQIVIPVTDDIRDEPDETVTLTLSGPYSTLGTSGTLGTAAATTVIKDNDAFSTLSISGPTTVSERAGTITFTVTRTGDTLGTSTVDYAISGSAGAGDVTQGGGTLTFAAGETTRQIELTTFDDTEYESTEAVTVTLSNPRGSVATALLGTARATTAIVDNDPQVITGSDGNDFYRVLALASRVSARGGDDEIIGGVGVDLIFGDAGNDRLDGGAGNDTLRGFLGTDVLFGGEGNDGLYGEQDNDFLGAGVGNDFASGGEGDDEVHGEAGDDTLFGDVGNDGLYGGAGADTVVGGAGADRLQGGDGGDRLLGEEGDDLAQGGDGADVISGGEGRDRVLGEAGNDLLFGDAGDDFVDGGEGNDELRGFLGTDTLFGGEGDDVLFGEGEDDFLGAGSGNDLLLGGAGVDSLHGEAGDDRLFGNAGDDDLNGGEGADTFVFGRGDGRDRVADFRAEDMLEFNGGLFGSAQAVLAASRQQGADVVITLDADTAVTLAGIQLATLAADDFRFA